MNTIYSWRTKKIGNKFEFSVIEIVSLSEPNENGSYANTKIIKTETRKTRAIAKTAAQKWVRYYKQLEKNAA